ncbi:AHL_G0040180.mRNA.1.CDS.1 [Saccharomyces cerevisiae]|nr:Cyb2p [Saccharomyces cerevisiae YJM1078]AJS63573.1 Cyb2p [Saccharomyces cerevisiae YJM248]AJS81046.1 Cyb2p [Saccharomyces cerevisiae YJM1252]CAI4628267.1 AVB_G0039630.mRNA.1.CDS.1 [Saccharomyces cerevisiae]CAI4663028.1 CPG_1a_G0040120.mRNA.1.CDS.1 [Saccharomyces cerevisiae]
MLKYKPLLKISKNCEAAILRASKTRLNTIRAYGSTVPKSKSFEQDSRKRTQSWTALRVGAILAATSSVAYLNWHNGQIDNEPKLDMNKQKISPAEVAKHNKPDDCWVVINGYVYDLTRFLPNHPGGQDVIKFNAGKDVTAIFEPLHAPNVIDKYIAPEKKLGPLQGSMPPELVCPPYAPGETKEDIARKEQLKSLLPPLDNIINLYDFEYLASQTLTKQAWAYYSSGANDEVTHRENHNAYHRIFFKPKILVDVRKVDISTDMLGSHVDVPFYVSATALCKLGNPLEGEKDVARGCGQGVTKVPQMISTLASCSPEEIIEAAPSDKQIQWYQLYVNSDRKITDDLVKNVEKLGVKALFVTVDAPSLGQREKDMKLKFSNTKAGPKAMKKTNVEESQGASRALSKFIDPSLTWKDIEELKKKTKLPIVIKGVQRTEDVIKAAEIGVSGVVLSNHGGRQLDFSRAPIEVLAETMPILEQRNLKDKLEVFVDGGVRRGTDVLKALCLGAKGVGLGRPFLYANSCYGRNGVEKAIEILRDEIEMSMRLLGVTSIAELKPDFLDLSTLKARTVGVPNDVLYNEVYEGPTLTEFEDA